MPTYTYLGERTAIALPPENDGEQPKEVALIPHQTVELPADLPYVKRLVALGLLKPIEAAPKAAKPTKTEGNK